MFCKISISTLLIILKILHKSDTQLIKKAQNQSNYLQNIIDNKELSTQFYCPHKCICETNSLNSFSNEIGS